MIAYLRSIGARHGVKSNFAELIAAAAAGDTDEVLALIADGLSPNGGDYDKRTPLHLAVGEAHAKVVDVLLAAGAEVNAVDRWNNTPIDDALRLPSDRGEPIVAALKAYGAVDRKMPRLSPIPAAKPVAKLEDEGTGSAGSAGTGSKARRFSVLRRDASMSSGQGSLEVCWDDIELKDRLGGGSFGDVFRANWKQTPVAAKSLKKLATDQERKLALADFEIEATILKNLVRVLLAGPLPDRAREGARATAGCWRPIYAPHPPT
mmetsp:Transcript_12138/g.28278  ORF Transcript_12138/g.28278 Transcript_12138/m.28278 type:complete len:263 (-) Transcript_12138:1147-1935(-)